MEIFIDVPLTTPECYIQALEKEYADLHEDSWPDDEKYREFWLGKSNEEYWCEAQQNGEEMVPEEDRFLNVWEAEEACGFAEGLIRGAIAQMEGNGGWAQGQIRQHSAEYAKGHAAGIAARAVVHREQLARQAAELRKRIRARRKRRA